MTPLITITPGLISEVVLIDLVALILAVATVAIAWYLVKRIYTNEVRELQFFLTFIGVFVPFVALVYFGLAMINYDAIATYSARPAMLPLKEMSPPVVGAAIFYMCQTTWLWWNWRKLSR